MLPNLSLRPKWTNAFHRLANSPPNFLEARNVRLTRSIYTKTVSVWQINARSVRKALQPKCERIAMSYRLILARVGPVASSGNPIERVKREFRCDREASRSQFLVRERSDGTRSVFIEAVATVRRPAAECRGRSFLRGSLRRQEEVANI